VFSERPSDDVADIAGLIDRVAFHADAGEHCQGGAFGEELHGACPKRASNRHAHSGLFVNQGNSDHPERTAPVELLSLLADVHCQNSGHNEFSRSVEVAESLVFALLCELAWVGDGDLLRFSHGSVGLFRE
jgi:hypothetical protein